MGVLPLWLRIQHNDRSLPTKFEKHLERKAPICYNFMVLTDEAP